MNTNPDELLSKIDSRLAIREARQTIAIEKQNTMKYKIDPAKMWNRFKTGDTERAFLISRDAKTVLALAAREVNELSGGARPEISGAETPVENLWLLERRGEGKGFYSNSEAKAVLTVAAAEYNAVIAAKAAKDARAAVIAKAAASTPPQKSSSATAPELAGLTGLARATAIHKQKAAAPVSVKPATSPSATAPETSTPAPHRPLHGLAKATAAHRGEVVTHSPPAELSGLARATAAHMAQAAARKK